MLSMIRKRVTFANVALTLALVFAMSGGAYAAKKYLITSTSQISPKVLSALKGKAGPAGPAGAVGVGTAGAQGPTGPAGAAGAKGETGPEGKEGKQGVPGSPGAKGAAGSPWTAGGTLPSKATETGAWAFGYLTEGATRGTTLLRVPISFTIPLAAGLEGTGCATVEPVPTPHVAATCQVHYINANNEEVISESENVPSTACTGTVEAPTAAPGNLCVYTTKLVAATFTSDSIKRADGIGGITGTATAGAMFNIKIEEEAEGWGTWAVTAE
jgi:hypothetical protein